MALSSFITTPLLFIIINIIIYCFIIIIFLIAMHFIIIYHVYQWTADGLSTKFYYLSRTTPFLAAATAIDFTTDACASTAVTPPSSCNSTPVTYAYTTTCLKSSTSTNHRYQYIDNTFILYSKDIFGNLDCQGNKDVTDLYIDECMGCDEFTLLPPPPTADPTLSPSVTPTVTHEPTQLPSLHPTPYPTITLSPTAVADDDALQALLDALGVIVLVTVLICFGLCLLGAFLLCGGVACCVAWLCPPNSREGGVTTSAPLLCPQDISSSNVGSGRDRVDGGMGVLPPQSPHIQQYQYQQNQQQHEQQQQQQYHAQQYHEVPSASAVVVSSAPSAPSEAALSYPVPTTSGANTSTHEARSSL
jgi:hypothetical protein